MTTQKESRTFYLFNKNEGQQLPSTPPSKCKPALFNTLNRFTEYLFNALNKFLTKMFCTLNKLSYLCRKFAALGNLKTAFIALVCTIFAPENQKH